MEKEIRKKLIAKGQLRRFKRHIEIQSELLASGKTLVSADSYEAAHAPFSAQLAMPKVYGVMAALPFSKDATPPHPLLLL
jgi:hypothetical protein